MSRGVVTVYPEHRLESLPIGTVLPFAGASAPAGFLPCAGQQVSRTDYAELFQVLVPEVGTADFSGNPTNAVPVVAGHGLQTGDAIFFTTTGTLPSPLAPNTIYYVGTTGTNFFHVVTVRGNTSGVAISTTGSGVHTVYHCPYGLGDGATTFNLPDLRGRTWVGLDRLNEGDAGRLDVLNALGLTGGTQKHTLTVDEMPSHTHLQNSHNHTQNSHNHTQNAHNHAGWEAFDYQVGGGALFKAAYIQSTGVSAPNATQNTTATNNPTTATNNPTTATNQNTGGGQAHENMPPYMLGGWIIKAKSLMVLAAGLVPDLSTLAVADRVLSVADSAISTMKLDDGAVTATKMAASAGPILAEAIHEPGSIASVTENSNTAKLVNAALTVTFTMPPSGAVMVEMSSLMSPSTSAETYWALLNGSDSLITASVLWMMGAVGTSWSQRMTYQKRMTGTPGASVTYKWAFFRGPSGSAETSIFFGGNYGPAVMTVRACV